MLHLSGKLLPLLLSLRTAASRHLIVHSLLLALGTSLPAADLDESQASYRAGKYDECIDAAKEAMARNAYGEDWPLLKIESDMQLGRYADALQTLEARLKEIPLQCSAALGRPSGVVATTICRTSAKAVGRDRASLATRAPYRYNDSANRVTLGQYLRVDRGADARTRAGDFL